MVRLFFQNKGNYLNDGYTVHNLALVVANPQQGAAPSGLIRRNTGN